MKKIVYLIILIGLVLGLACGIAFIIHKKSTANDVSTVISISSNDIYELSVVHDNMSEDNVLRDDISGNNIPEKASVSQQEQLSATKYRELENNLKIIKELTDKYKDGDDEKETYGEVLYEETLSEE